MVDTACSSTLADMGYRFPSVSIFTSSHETIYAISDGVRLRSTFYKDQGTETILTKRAVCNFVRNHAVSYVALSANTPVDLTTYNVGVIMGSTDSEPELGTDRTIFGRKAESGRSHV